MQSRHITPHLLCGLTWVNVFLSLVLVVQQQDVGRQAYLLENMPGSAQRMIKDATITRDRLTRTVAIDSLAPVADVPVEDIQTITLSSSASPASPISAQSVSSLSSSSSEISTTSAPFLEIPTSSQVSSRSISEQMHHAAESSVELHLADSFPEFGNAAMPVNVIPNWGAMKSAQEWNRSYTQMKPDDFVPVPFYDLITLTIPLKTLEKTRNTPQTINFLTEKLFYSTRYFGAYDIDADEFTAIHPGIDLKLAEDTPVGAVAGGRVHEVRRDEHSLGLHVIIEHRAPDDKTYYSVYGHLATATVKNGDDVQTGQQIGTVGMTGNTSGPHLHLQIDRGEPDEQYHTVYWPDHIPSRQEADLYEISPIRFVQLYR